MKAVANIFYLFDLFYSINIFFIFYIFLFNIIFNLYWENKFILNLIFDWGLGIGDWGLGFGDWA